MTEEKKQEFKKTIELSVDQVREIIDTQYGVKLKMNDIPTDHRIILKILEPVKENKYTMGEEEKISYSLWCEYKPAGCDSFELEVQAGEGCVKRLQEKYPKDSYVNMYAMFSRTSYQGKYPQFINPMKKYQERKDVDELFQEKVSKKKQAVAGSPVNLEPFAEFKKTYDAALKKNGKEPNAIHMLGSYIGSIEKERTAELLKLCNEACK